MLGVSGIHIDMHVHVVGNGRSGSGCWIRPTGWYGLLGRFMLRHIGLSKIRMDDPAFDESFVARLVELVRSSSLAAESAPMRIWRTRTDSGLKNASLFSS